MAHTGKHNAEVVAEKDIRPVQTGWLQISIRYDAPGGRYGVYDKHDGLLYANISHDACDAWAKRRGRLEEPALKT